MVLVLNGVLQTKCPQNMEALYNSYPIYRDTANHFLSIPNKIIGPSGLLYVMQREFAATIPHDKNVSVMGTDDCTSCMAIVLRHSGSGAIALAHLDTVCTEEVFNAVLHKVQQLSHGYPEGRLELQIIAGYSDPQGCSEKVFSNLTQAVHKQIVEVDLLLACIGSLNTIMRGDIPWPIVYGAGVDIRTGEIFPATFPEKGPDECLRCAPLLAGESQFFDVYDSALGLLRIGPCNYKPLRGVDLWLEQNDQFIRRNLSTTPDVEPPHYVAHIRATLEYIRDNPFPAVTVFRDNKPRYYGREEGTGLWVPVVF